jgi:subtilisin family serine protease
VIGGYIVELFRPDPLAANVSVAALYERLRAGLERLSSGLDVRPLASSGGIGPGLSIQLTGGAEKQISLPFARDEAEETELAVPMGVRVPRNFDLAQHTELLNFLSTEPLVRSIDLPISIESFPAKPGTTEGPASFAPPAANRAYPVVGIVDGGVADVPVVTAWRKGACGHLPKSDRDESHGTFIAGILAGGAALNRAIAAEIEPVGCQFFDIDVLPRQGIRDKYYGSIEEFFDQLEEMIDRAKREAKVRVFNMSIGQRNPLQGYGYTRFAQLLDAIARQHDVVFVVSAGNLGRFQRPPWPADGSSAVQMLASRSAADERILPPSEHLLGLSVGAINPPGLDAHVARMPTTYTCRGPGAGAARKPDLAHFGGCGRDGSNRTGLFSVDSTGALIQSAGTSFASPHVAATVAALDHLLEGQSPRETLLALPVHHAARAPELQHKALRHIARDYVGFGKPDIAERCLTDDPHSITLVFSERLPERKDIHFQFNWPPSLAGSGGKCRGVADLTLVYTPPIDASFGEECLRVRIEASLQQEHILEAFTGDSEWKTRTKHDDTKLPDGLALTESYLLQSGLKWTPIKRVLVEMKNGVGNSTNWRLRIGYSVRAGARFPSAGVPFTVLLTLRDPNGDAPVYDEMRNQVLQKYRLADITVAHRVRPRR